MANEQAQQVVDEKRTKAETAAEAEAVVASATNSTDSTELKVKRAATTKGNIHHVAPVGVLIVLFTLYLSALALQRNCEHNAKLKEAIQNDAAAYKHEANGDANEEQYQLCVHKLTDEEVEATYQQFEAEVNANTNDNDSECQAVKEMLLEYLHESWVEFNRQHDAIYVERNPEDDEDNYQQCSAREAVAQTAGGGDDAAPADESVANDDHGNAKQNGYKRYAHKKLSPEEPKKSSAAEPIIYLFALVFIYLLVKAASDINQHYKTNPKGDKRMRRCSLQSYAQTNRQDRRASKDIALAKKLRHGKSKLHFTEARRSKSLDPHSNLTESLDYVEKKKTILANLRRYTSVDEQPIQWLSNETATLATTTNIEMATNSTHHTAAAMNVSRRCSMPITAMPQQMHGLPSGTYPMMAPQMERRMSMATLGSGPAGDGVNYEVKRRVRMINRH